MNNDLRERCEHQKPHSKEKSKAYRRHQITETLEINNYHLNTFLQLRLTKFMMPTHNNSNCASPPRAIKTSERKPS